MSRFTVLLNLVSIIALASGVAHSAQVPSTVKSSPAVSLRGSVTDSRGDLVRGARVRAVNISSGRTATTVTGSDGRYELNDLTPGVYRLFVGGGGFATASRDVNARGDTPIVEDFALVPGMIEDSMTVTAGKGGARSTHDVPQVVTVVDAFEMEERRPASTFQALERTPNVAPVGANPVAQRPRLRGLTSNRVLVVIDGERLNNVRSDPLSGVSPGVVDVSEVESAEVLSGAGSSLYGSDALGGTINLVTKSPTRSEGERHFGLRLSGDARTNGRFRRPSASFDFSTPRFALSLSGSFFRSEDYKAGGRGVNIEDVVRLGGLVAEMSNAIGSNAARTYAVWSLPPGARIPNGGGLGFNERLDAWLYPSSLHGIRLRQSTSQHKNIGFPFITPPFDTRRQSNAFRRLDKYGARYEGRELKRWLPHVAAGFYRQRYSFPDGNFISSIANGSSWTLAPDAADSQRLVPTLTGRPSTFVPVFYNESVNSLTSYGFDVQATIAPLERLLFTSGAGYLREDSKDDFSRYEIDPSTLASRNSVGGKASNPDSVYRNLGWFNLIEYEASRRLRLTGSFRIDRWTTEAKVTKGFPPGRESTLIGVSLSRLLAAPGQIDPSGTSGIVELVNGTRGFQTLRTVFTGNLGLVVRMPGGMAPFARFGTSYREPGITERYILRDFGDPTFSLLLVPNISLRPERGRNFEAGFKVRRDRFNGSFVYFRNDLSDFIRPAFAPPIFVPADPSRGLFPLSPFFPFHGILYVQRTNTARARIRGFEGAYEASIPLRGRGTLTPFGTMGWLKGSDLAPDQNVLKLIRQFYNRFDTPLLLVGSTNDAPLSGITPFRGSFGARYGDRRGRWFGEYEVLHQTRIRRVDPLELSSTISTQYGTLASLSPFYKQTVRAGYVYSAERNRTLLTFGVENLTNRFYFEGFQTSPAPGRSYVFGVTFDFFKSF